MGNRLLGIAVLVCAVSVLWAKRVDVDAGSVSDLMEKCANAQAGDTIWVPAGDYNVGSVETPIDSGRGGKGWDRGLLWMGLNNGTAEHPIVLVGEDPANPPVIHGNGISGNYHNQVIHINNDYVILKNLKLHSAVRAITIDHGSHVTVEDCELYHTGQEVVHIRDSSSYVLFNRNNIHDGGNTKGTYGEGMYIGTDKDAWGVDGESDALWGSQAKSYKSSGNLSYYDWRVNHTNVTCNVIHGVSAEDIDIKEGSSDAYITKNMFAGDSIQLKPNGEDYDNSFIEVKGIRNTIVGNYLYTANNSKVNRYIEEVYRGGSSSNVPDNLTADEYPANAHQWCDNSGTDKNQCDAGDNMFIDYIGEVRNLCAETFVIPGKPIAYSGVYKDAPSIPWVGSSVVLRVEAEDMDYTKTGNCTNCSNASVKASSATSGGKYLATADAILNFTVDAPAAGKYNLSLHYAYTNSDQTKYKNKEFYVNGIQMNEIHFASTGGTALTFADEVVGVWLNKGTNTLEIQRGWGAIDLDYVEFVGVDNPNPVGSSSSTAVSSSSAVQSSSSQGESSSSSVLSSSSGVESSSSVVSSSSSVVASSSSQTNSSSSSLATSSSSITMTTVRYEAENANYGDAMKIAREEASGGYYIFTQKYDIAFMVDVPVAGNYDMLVRFSNSSAGDKKQEIKVNEASMGQFDFPVTIPGDKGYSASKFESKIIPVDLNKGSNKIEIVHSWGYVDIDFIEISVPNVGSSSSAMSSSGSVESSSSGVSSSSSVVASSSSSVVSSSSVQSSSSFADYSSSSMAEEGIVPQIAERFDVVSVLGTKLRLKVPALGSFRVMVFDLNGNKVNKLSSGRYIVHVSARGYSKFTSVVIK